MWSGTRNVHIYFSFAKFPSIFLLRINLPHPRLIINRSLPKDYMYVGTVSYTVQILLSQEMQM